MFIKSKLSADKTGTVVFIERLNERSAKMAEEPQPPNVREGLDQPDVLPANAEDRKAAAALSSLDAKGEDDAAPPKKEVDLKALGEAMKNLEFTPAPKKPTETARKEEAPKKLVKVDPADVALLVGSCSLSVCSGS